MSIAIIPSNISAADLATLVEAGNVSKPDATKFLLSRFERYENSDSKKLVPFLSLQMLVTYGGYTGKSEKRVDYHAFALDLLAKSHASNTPKDTPKAKAPTKRKAATKAKAKTEAPAPAPAPTKTEDSATDPLAFMFGHVNTPTPVKAPAPTSGAPTNAELRSATEILLRAMVALNG